MLKTTISCVCRTASLDVTVFCEGIWILNVTLLLEAELAEYGVKFDKAPDSTGKLKGAEWMSKSLS